jgi:hypothetical protein
MKGCVFVGLPPLQIERGVGDDEWALEGIADVDVAASTNAW